MNNEIRGLNVRTIKLYMTVCNKLLLAQYHCIECHYAECCYAECHDLLIVMLNVIMLSVIMLSVIMLSVIMLSVAAPFDFTLRFLKIEIIEKRIKV